MTTGHFRIVLSVALLAVSLLGCDMVGGASSVKFDATSLASSRESLQKMTAGLTTEQKEAFLASASAVAMKANEGTQNTASAETFWKGVHGLSKAEIEAKAKELPAPAAAATP